MPATDKFLHRLSLFLILPLLLIYSIVFAFDRLYGDSAGYLYTLIQTGHFFLAHSRPASIFIEWLPLLLIKCKAPLTIVIYSMSIAEWLYIFAWYITFSLVLKVPRYGLALVICYLFGIRWNYYNPVSELILAFPFALFLSWYWQLQQTKMQWWLIISLTTTAFLVFSHPLYVIVVPIIFAYLHSHLFTKRNLLFAAGFAGLVAALYLRLDGYEKTIIDSNAGHQSFQVGQTLKILFQKETLKGLIRSYAGLIIFVILFILYLYRQQKYYQLASVILFAGGYFLYIWFKYSDYYPFRFEPLERYLFIIPLVITCLATPMLARLKKWHAAILAILLVYHIGILGYYGWFVKQRYQLIDKAISNSRQYKETKVVYRIENYVYDMAVYPGHSWVMFYETMLLTAAEDKNNTRQVFLTDVASVDFLKNRIATEYYSDYGERVDDINKLNPDYFNMQPSAWRSANTDSIQTGLDSIIPKITLSIPRIVRLSVEEYYIVKVRLTNTTTKTVYSGMQQQKRGISYRWKNTQTHEVVNSIEYITPLMCDLYTGIEQQMVIFGPPSTGNYILEVGYSTDNPKTFIPFSQLAQTVTITEREIAGSKLWIPVP